MANNILKCDTPLEVKKLSYNISSFNRTKWASEGYEICAKGIREKFLQHRLLMEMLKGTSTKVLAEASKDKLWGTGIPLQDPDVLKTNKWENEGWLSNILATIRNDLC